MRTTATTTTTTDDTDTTTRATHATAMTRARREGERTADGAAVAADRQRERVAVLVTPRRHSLSRHDMCESRVHRFDGWSSAASGGGGRCRGVGGSCSRLRLRAVGVAEHTQRTTRPTTAWHDHCIMRARHCDRTTPVHSSCECDESRAAVRARPTTDQPRARWRGGRFVSTLVSTSQPDRLEDDDLTRTHTDRDCQRRAEPSHEATVLPPERTRTNRPRGLAPCVREHHLLEIVRA